MPASAPRTALASEAERLPDMASGRNYRGAAETPALPLTPPPHAERSPLPSALATADRAMEPSGAPEDLFSKHLLLPVQGVNRNALVDVFDAPRSGNRKHEALDIMAARGTPVLAADNGRIVKLFNSKPGGLTVYQFDETETWCYYYAHLDHYSDTLKEGMTVSKGDTLGYVGSTGDADPSAPHLHFAIFKLGPEKRWWEGTPVNPYPLFAPQQ